MKIKDYICKCGCDDFVIIPQKPATIGIYCTKCGKWLKWADKDEKNLMKLQPEQSISLNSQQKLAIKAMLFAFDKYGADRLIGSRYIDNVNKYPESTIDFGEAYNICAYMIEENKE